MVDGANEGNGHVGTAGSTPPRAGAIADALVQSELKLNAAARLAGLGYWEDEVLIDRISWSEHACHVLGLPMSERARSWDGVRDLVFPDDRAAVEDARARVRRGEPTPRLAFRTLLPGGSVRHVEAVPEAILDRHGTITRVVGAILDVSDRKQADAVLHDSQERLRVALEATGLGIWDWDLNTNAVQFWPEWKRQLGYEPDELPNHYEEWESRLHADDRARVLTALRAYLDGRQPEYALEFRLRHRSGAYRWIYTRGAVLRDATGRHSQMIGCHLDITERKQLEEQYRQSQKMQAVGQLAGGIAHDFNNLLTVINGFAELALAQLGPAHRAHRDLEQIRVAASSAASLTGQLLAFSRRQVLAPQVLDVGEVVNRMRRVLDRVVGESITLTLALSASSTITADPGQIEQVIVNLAVNARDAMPGGGRLLIETSDVDVDSNTAGRHRGTSPGKYVLLAVSDTGTGMDGATLAQLFEPFFTTKPTGRGTGLGLATVQSIVKQSGGSIHVDSEPGRGTTFRIYLPAVTAGVVAPVAPSHTSPLHGTETVLVVEDQSGVRHVIERTLQRYGYTVIAASSGAEAAAVARRHGGPIHVMLADVVLPGGSGREAARLVRATRPTVRVLYTSGYTDDAIVRHGVLEPGLAFIQKPFAGDDLARKIREVLAAVPPPLC